MKLGFKVSKVSEFPKPAPLKPLSRSISEAETLKLGNFETWYYSSQGYI